MYAPQTWQRLCQLWSDAHNARERCKPGDGQVYASLVEIEQTQRKRLAEALERDEPKPEEPTHAD